MRSLKKTALQMIRNKYFLTLICFVLWMTFFDNNDFYRQYKVQGKLSELSEEAVRREKTNEEVRYSLELLKDKKHLEQFAREEYRFKKPDEDIFVIVAAE
jgi:cell division protein FtsB